MSIVLRDYQRAAVQAPKNFLHMGKRKMIISLPTGAGKTVVAGQIIQDLITHPSEHALFVVPRIALVNQTYESFSNDFFLPSQLGIIQGDRKQYGRQITIASMQTLSKPAVMQKYLTSIGRGLCDVVIFDEVHMFGYEGIIEECLTPGGLLIGLSATPYRADMQSLKKYFPDDICCVEEYWDLIKQGWLVDITSYDVKADMPSVIETHIDPLMRHYEGLSVTREQNYRYAKIYTEWLDKGEHKRTLGFCQSVKDCYTFRLFLQAMGETCEVISSKTSDEHRDMYIKQFKAGELTFLLNYDVMTTGVDIPEIECLIMMRQTSNLGIWSQSIGRGLRLCHALNKQRIIVLNCTQDGHTLMMFSRLFGIEGANIPSIRMVLKAKEEKEQQQEAEFQQIYILNKTIPADAPETSLFFGNGWICDTITKCWHKEWALDGQTYHLHATRLATGCYQPLVVLPSGEEYIISDALLTKNDALFACQKHMVSVEKGAQKVRERDPEEMRKPIRPDQIDYLLKRKVPLRPVSGKINKPLSREQKIMLLGEMKQQHFLEINDHLKKYKEAHTPDGVHIGYFGDSGVKVWRTRD